MLESVLVPLDGSELAEGALSHALAVIRVTGGQLTVVHVLETGAPAAEGMVVDPLDWHLRKAEATSYLETVARRLEEAGHSVETVLLEGKAAEQIVDFARKRAIDLIVLSTHGQSGLSRWNVSSVVQKIIFLANTSVLLVRAYRQPDTTLEERRYRRVLAPLDGSRRAEYALPVLRALAQDEACAPWLVSVVTRPEMPRHAPLAPEDAALADRLVARNREEADRYLAQLEERMSPVQVRTLVGDSVIGTLHDFVEEEEINLVVFTAHGYTGRSHHPYGSVVTSFIVYGSTPLLIVQDIPQSEMEPGEAEVVAGQTGKSDSGKGGRKVVHARSTN